MSTAPLAALLEHALKLNPDELRVLGLIAKRLVAGREQYGPLDLATDKRDFRAEAGEELLDGCVYLAMRALQVEPTSRPTKAVPCADCGEPVTVDASMKYGVHVKCPTAGQRTARGDELCSDACPKHPGEHCMCPCGIHGEMRRGTAP